VAIDSSSGWAWKETSVAIGRLLDRADLAQLGDAVGVEAELGGSNSAPAAGRSRPRAFPQRTSDSQPQAASAKQLGYLRDIALRQGMSPQQLDDKVRQAYGAAALRDLTRQQASELIEQLGGNSRRQSRKAA